METNNNSHLIRNEKFKIVKITEDMYDEAIDIFKTFYLKHENISKVVNILASEQSVQEMVILLKALLKQSLSFAAIHCETKEMAAFVVNFIKNPSANLQINDIVKNFNTPAMAMIADYLKRMEQTVDLYKEWNIECLFHMKFLAVRKPFSGNGLTTILFEHSMAYARQMANGTLPDSEDLPDHIRAQKPDAVTSVLTSYFTQQVGRKFNFETIHKVKYTEFSYKGQTFADFIDPIHAHVLFVAQRL